MAEKKTDDQPEPTIEVELAVSFGGILGGQNSPRQGTVVLLTEEQADAFEESGRGKRVKPKTKQTAKKATKKVETAKGESGPEKRG